MVLENLNNNVGELGNPQHKEYKEKGVIDSSESDAVRISRGPKDSEEDSGMKLTEMDVNGTSDKDGDDDQATRTDLNNLETTMNVSPIPTTRIDKDHPKDQIIRNLTSAIQTRRMTKISDEYAMVSYINKLHMENTSQRLSKLLLPDFSHKKKESDSKLVKIQLNRSNARGDL
ncbi:hypothetical protein Tco_1555568 [Tanacetum coccineum]